MLHMNEKKILVTISDKKNDHQKLFSTKCLGLSKSKNGSVKAKQFRNKNHTNFLLNSKLSFF